MKKTIQFLLMTVAMLLTTVVIAQSTITGTVIDSELNTPLPGANVVEKGTSNGVSTDFDGNFKLTTQAASGEIVISYVGYGTVTVAFNGSANLGKISVSPDNTLEVVVITGTGIVDLAEDRKTPIAVSTIKSKEIQEKAGNWDLPEVLKSTPSVQNVKGGGFGDGSMYLRGFDQTNTAFLLNGQPINGVEDGKMYWSNWSGVLDIANAVQVQRGLGSSKLAISSVGGTVNIVTKTVDRKEGGFFQTMVGNDDYIKTSAYYSTGLMENGLAFSAMLGHWQGDGYMQGSKGQGQTYFISVGYKPNENHIFNFLVTGAPQWHGAAGGNELQDYLDYGRRYSDWWGYYNGEEYAGGRNYYHKPVINLTWDWTINDRSELSTVAYGSFGRGGFAYPEGSSFYGFRDANGKLDYDAIEANNLADPSADNYVKSSINSHNWFGVLSNFSHELSENLSFNVGVDTRFYKGIHYRTAADLLGATPSVTSNYGGTYTLTEDSGFNPWSNLFKLADRNQRFSYDYEEQINYIGGFGQIEYATDAFSAYFQGAISTQSHLKTDYWNYTEATEADKVNNAGFNLKAGGAYNINEDNRVFVNAGFYSRQPYHDDLFTNIRSSNELNPLAGDNQEITGLEAGYQFKSERVSFNLNAYHTIWDNRILSSAEDTDNNGQSDIFYQSSGIKEVHQGLELEVFTRPIDRLNLNGFISVGNWEYNGNVETRSYDENDVLLSSGDVAYIDGVKIGNAAQFTAGANAVFEIVDDLKFDAAFNYYDQLYASVDLGASEFTTASNRGALELPSYQTVDLGMSYRMPVGKQANNLQFRVNVNNVFDELYIEQATSNIHDVDTAGGYTSWNGISSENEVYLGYGITWNVSLRYNF
ncbi:TonB-dependent receptor domain-containing protein [Seonamhaeicola sp.]|uniref:TonB-dependent receptor n=1 Tax=Seonamhaeicola sp. TaxID=1912245 RepID=UPI003566190E